MQGQKKRQSRLSLSLSLTLASALRSLSLACLLWLLSCCCCFCCIFAWPTSTAGQQRVQAEQQLFGQAEELNERMRNASTTIRSVGSLPLPAFVTRAVSSCCSCVNVYCCYRLIYCCRRRCCTLFALVLCLFIHLPIVVVNIVIIIVGFLGKTRTHIVPKHDANDTFPQKQTKTTAISRCISAIPPTILIPLKFRK